MNKATLVLFAALMALSACNTIEGLGKDVKNGGEAMTDAAQKTKEKINEGK